MRTSIAWRNVFHDKRRTIAASSGVAFAILLVFMQLGFYTACQTSATMVYDTLDFDAILISKPYVHLRYSDTIPRSRLYQASAVSGVASSVPIYVTTGMWRNAASKISREILVLGVNPADQPFRLDEINRNLHLLAEPDTAIVDQVARPLVGPHGVGTVTELNGQRIEVVADYSRGSGLIADAAVLVSDLTMSRLVGKPKLDRVQLGLIRFADEARPELVLRRLRATMPADTAVWSREELKAHEQHFFLFVKPVGFMFTSGVFVGFLVGAVIMYQILSADIAAQIPQYATLKAVGYGPGYLSRVVMTQGILFAILGYLPALVLSFGIYALVRNLADLPMYLTPMRALFVLALSIGMCVLSGLLAVRKVHAADPADLF
jgi:putative ABC transport system permease protein